MSIKDLLSLADDKLQELFHTKPHDPEKARKPIVAGIDRTKSQFASTEPVKGRKWFKIANGVVEVNLPFMLGGKSTHYVPSERFNDFLDKLKALVTKGDLDKEIEAGVGEVEAKPMRSASGAKRAGWSEERRRKHAETVAARKAAQA